MNATVVNGSAASRDSTRCPRSANVRRSVTSATDSRNPAQKPAGFAERTTSTFRKRFDSIAASAVSSSVRRAASSALTGSPGKPSQSVPTPYSAVTTPPPSSTHLATTLNEWFLYRVALSPTSSFTRSTAAALFAVATRSDVLPVADGDVRTMIATVAATAITIRITMLHDGRVATWSLLIPVLLPDRSAGSYHAGQHDPWKVAAANALPERGLRPS